MVLSGQVLVQDVQGILDHVDLHLDVVVHEPHAACGAVHDASGLGEVLVADVPDAVHPTCGGFDVLLQVVPAGPRVLPRAVRIVEEDVPGSAVRAGVESHVHFREGEAAVLAHEHLRVVLCQEALAAAQDHPVVDHQQFADGGSEHGSGEMHGR